MAILGLERVIRIEKKPSKRFVKEIERITGSQLEGMEKVGLTKYTFTDRGPVLKDTTVILFDSLSIPLLPTIEEEDSVIYLSTEFLGGREGR